MKALTAGRLARTNQRIEAFFTTLKLCCITGRRVAFAGKNALLGVYDESEANGLSDAHELWFVVKYIELRFSHDPGHLHIMGDESCIQPF